MGTEQLNAADSLQSRLILSLCDSTETMKININSIEKIDEVSGLLHDATISFDEIDFEEQTRSFTAVFNRHMWEKSKRRGILKRMNMQAVHSRLTFENVESMDIDTKNELYPINEVSFIEGNNSNVSIHFHKDFVLPIQGKFPRYWSDRTNPRHALRWPL